MQLAGRLKAGACIAAGLIALAANVAVFSGAVVVTRIDWFWGGLFPQLLAILLIAALFKYCFYRLFGEDPGEYRFNRKRRPSIAALLPSMHANQSLLATVAVVLEALAFGLGVWFLLTAHIPFLLK